MNFQRSETWLPVADFPGYQVSDLGRVASLDRYVRDCNGRLTHRQGRILKAQLDGSGYQQVTLPGHRLQFVHHLVLKAFAGPRPDGMECLHGPGGKTDNRWPENIKWGTKAENEADKRHDGNHPLATLDDVTVLACRLWHSLGAEDYRAWAQQLGVSTMTLWNAVHGKRWRHLPMFSRITIIDPPVHNHATTRRTAS